MDIFNLTSVLTLSTEPEDKEQFNQWIEQKDICSYLENEINDEHIILYASLHCVFINSVLIPSGDFNASDIEGLLEWNVLSDSCWGVVSSSERVWLEAALSGEDSELLRQGEQLLFYRQFDGAIDNRFYYELSQKLTHVLEIHFVPERNAWCNLNELGDVEEIVKIIRVDSTKKRDGGIIISMQKKALEKYTTLADSTLLRMFDFTRYKTGSFNGWHKGAEESLKGENIFGRLVVESGYGSYSRGIQIADIKYDKQRLIDKVWGHEDAENPKEYATFITQDWKHGIVSEISCNPTALGNYFVKSDLPFETSPVFFNPEVLIKYKSDREKYQLKSRSVSCRGGWGLRTFDINDAGQVHTYINYLGNLPYEEQLHWKQYNEPPKTDIAARAIKTDFEGSRDTQYDSLDSLKYKLSELDRADAKWWVLRNAQAIDKVNYPYTTSRDEWADETLNLDQLLVEGLEEKWLRRKAQELGRSPDDRFRSLKLLEECLVGVGFEEDHAREILGVFHDVHNLRSKLKGHISGDEAAEIRRDALRKFGSLRKHFEDICIRCDESLGIIMRAFRVF